MNSSFSIISFEIFEKNELEMIRLKKGISEIPREEDCAVYYTSPKRWKSNYRPLSYHFRLLCYLATDIMIPVGKDVQGGEG